MAAADNRGQRYMPVLERASVVVLHILLKQLTLLCTSQQLHICTLDFTCPQAELALLEVHVALANVAVLAKLLRSVSKAGPCRDTQACAVCIKLAIVARTQQHSATEQMPQPDNCAHTHTSLCVILRGLPSSSSSELLRPPLLRLRFCRFFLSVLRLRSLRLAFLSSLSLRFLCFLLLLLRCFFSLPCMSIMAAACCGGSARKMSAHATKPRGSGQQRIQQQH
jgi:hypothetical protein